MSVVDDMTARERALGATAQYIRQIREAAAGADTGRWHRTHSQIVSSSAKGGCLVALAEGIMLKGGWQPDMTKAAANARYITAVEPFKMLALCDVLEKLEPELKTIHATLTARFDAERAAKKAARGQ